MSNVNDTDKFLVNRNNTSYQVEAQNLMADLQDTDLMLVNRGGTSYKATGADIKESLNPQSSPVVNLVTLAEGAAISGSRFGSQTFTSTVNLTPGEPSISNTSIKATLQAKIVDRLETSDITNVQDLESGWEYTNLPNSVSCRGLTYADGKFVAVSRDGFERAFYSTDGINWSNGDLVDDKSWQMVAYGNGVFCTVGDNSPNTATSANGINWTNHYNKVVQQGWRGLTFGGGKFVAVADNTNSRAMYSTDGINWTKGNYVPDNAWTAVTYGNGRFVAVAIGGSTYSMHSDDGIDWNPGNAPAGNWNAVAYGGDKFVAVGNGSGGNHINYSFDGINWFPASAPAAKFKGVGYGAGKFVAVIGDNDSTSGICYSRDGITWTQTLSAVGRWYTPRFGDNKWVVVSDGSTPNVAYSATGGEPAKLLTFDTDKDLENFEPNYVVNQSTDQTSGIVSLTDVGEKTMTVVSTDGTWTAGSKVQGPPRNLETSEITSATTIGGSWNRVNQLAGPNWQRVAGGPVGTYKFCACQHTSSGYFAFSEDGKNWINVGDSRNWEWTGITYGDGKYVSVGTNCVMWTNDGITLNTYGTSEGIAGQWTSVVYGDGKFVAVGESGSERVMYSTDAISWTGVNLSNQNTVLNQNWEKVTYGNGVWVATCINGGQSNQIMWSNDAINWNLASSEIEEPRGCDYGAGKFVVVGSDGDEFADGTSYRVMTSPDGKNWTKHLCPSGGWRDVRYAQGKFVAVADGKTMTSVDGINWTQSLPGGNSGWEGVAYYDDKWVSVAPYGNESFMWSTTGGIDDVLLGFANDKSLALLEVSDSLEQSDYNASGNVAVVDVSAKTIQVTNSNGSWSANSGKYIIGPSRASSIDATLFARLDALLNVVDLQKADPGFVQYNGFQPTIKFPYYLPNGEPSDSTLLAGSSIFTTIQADNLVPPASVKDSNTVTPATTCIPGAIETSPITETEIIDGAWSQSFAPNGYELYAAAYGDGNYVCVGQEYAQHSLDGITWTSVFRDYRYRDVVYADGMFVAVGDTGSFRTMYSLDGGRSWTSGGGVNNNDQFQSVTYGNGRFVAVPYNTTQPIVSLDGKEWVSGDNLINEVGNNTWRSVAYGNNKYVAVSSDSNPRVMVSSNGINWKGIYNNGIVLNSWNSICYCPPLNRFVAVSTDGSRRVMYSDDEGQTWTPADAAQEASWVRVKYANGKFVAIAQSSIYRSMTSADGINWTGSAAPSSETSQNWYGLTYGEDKWISCGSSKVTFNSPTGGSTDTRLSFDNPTGLIEYKSSDSLQQEDSAASGQAGAIDLDNSTVDILNSSGTWQVGKKVSGPNRICPPIVLDASDPLDVAQFNAIKASFDGYETDRDTRRANLKSAMLAANFTSAEITMAELDDA